MGKLRRLKEIKIKNKIKATTCGLALSLAIGSVQGLGTYALFTDTEDVASNLAISIGDVDVEIDKTGKILSEILIQDVDLQIGSDILEDTDVPSEPDVVEPPKEEEPSEPEVVEPPKEEEPSEPEVVEPSKEEEPSESEVVLLN